MSHQFKPSLTKLGEVIDSVKVVDSVKVIDSVNANKITPADCNQSAAKSDSPSSSNVDAYLETYSETYFDELYSDNTDPWQYQTRWYEKRKRDICLAVLPLARYGNGIELGCGNGVFSELLADRCQALVSVDGNTHAVQLAAQRLASMPHVKVIQAVIPSALVTLTTGIVDADGLSDDSSAYKPAFDLIVISEILYYLSPDDIHKVIAWIRQNLAIGGTLLCCHWRYAIDGFAMTGETVHQRLHQAFNAVNNANTLSKTNNQQNNSKNSNNQENQPATFSHQSQIIDNDFLLDVWQNSLDSVARQENLI